MYGTVLTWRSDTPDLQFVAGGEFMRIAKEGDFHTGFLSSLSCGSVFQDSIPSWMIPSITTFLEADRRLGPRSDRLATIHFVGNGCWALSRNGTTRITRIGYELFDYAVPALEVSNLPDWVWEPPHIPVHSFVEEALPILLKRPAYEPDSGLFDQVFQMLVRENPVGLSDLVESLAIDCSQTEAFGHSYKRVLQHVWQIIISHTHREELYRRLVQGLIESLGTSSQEKLSCLVNVLRGFDAELDGLTDPKTVFAEHMAALRILDPSIRRVSMIALCDRYGMAERDRVLG